LSYTTHKKEIPAAAPQGSREKAKFRNGVNRTAGIPSVFPLQLCYYEISLIRIGSFNGGTSEPMTTSPSSSGLGSTITIFLTCGSFLTSGNFPSTNSCIVCTGTSPCFFVQAPIHFPSRSTTVGPQSSQRVYRRSCSASMTTKSLESSPHSSSEHCLQKLANYRASTIAVSSSTDLPSSS